MGNSCEHNMKIMFQHIIPPLTAEEYSLLEESIKLEGCREALIVWHGILVDGHNRYEICEKWGIPFKQIEMPFQNEAEVEIWIIQNQLGRRNISLFTRGTLALKLKPLLAEESKKTQGKKNLLQNSVKSDTQKQLAKAAGISHDTIHKIETIHKFGGEELIAECFSGETTINDAYGQIKKKQREDDLQKQAKDIKEGKVKLPEGVYEVIAIDPPWPYGHEYDEKSWGKWMSNPYPEMSLEEIQAINLPASKDCCLFLWTTHAFLPDALKLIEPWGFTYKQTLVWNKIHMGMGSWFRCQLEFCIFAIKGKPKLLNKTSRDMMEEMVREHSRKPECFYELINNACMGRKLDYFSRQEREGWDNFGNNPKQFGGK
jgi:N6-adenosine-specific RNA methylase IME4